MNSYLRWQQRCLPAHKEIAAEPGYRRSTRSAHPEDLRRWNVLIWRFVDKGAVGLFSSFFIEAV